MLPENPDRTDGFAVDLADALCQLAALVRAQPLLARTLCWDLGTLKAGTHGVRDRAGLLTAAKALGVEAVALRPADGERGAVSLQFGRRRDVRVRIGAETPAAAPQPGARVPGAERPTVFVPELDTAQ